MRLPPELIDNLRLRKNGVWLPPLRWRWFRITLAVLILFDLLAPAMLLARVPVGFVHLSLSVAGHRVGSLVLPAPHTAAAAPNVRNASSATVTARPITAAQQGTDQSPSPPGVVVHPVFDGGPDQGASGQFGPAAPVITTLPSPPEPHPDGPPDHPSVLVATPKPAQSVHIPVLMYHQIAPQADRYVTPLWMFEQELDWLVANGYHSVTITQVYDAMFDDAILPANPVVISLDDGTAGHWDAAAALDARGMHGVFLIPSGASELTPDQIRSLSDRGHEIVAHSVTHPFLTQISNKQLAHEVRQSKTDLEAITGKPVNFFGYPFGDLNDRVVNAVASAGYRGALQAWGGEDWTPEKRWVEPRVEISGLLSLDEFATTVQTGE